MADTPSTAITTNQTSMMGPNARPIFSVPNCCVVNNTTRISTAMGMTYGLKLSVATLTPSIALNTEIAGVITPSP